MNAGAALGGVQAEASLSLGVVGDLGAAIGVHGGVGFASRYDLNAASSQQRAQPHAEGECEGFFQLIVSEASAGVVSAVGRVQHHDEAGWRSGRGGLRGERQD